MPTAERRRTSDSVTPPRVRLEEAAIAILIERIVNLDPDTKEDLMGVLLEMRDCKSDQQRQEIEQTILELMYPKMAGDLVVGSLDVEKPPTLTDWSRRIGERIRELRERRKMTQDQLSDASGLPQSHISRLENGAHSPSHKTLLAIAKALGVDVREIDPGSAD
jgi:DNA-binding XRE family transcriptional regulator